MNFEIAVMSLGGVLGLLGLVKGLKLLQAYFRRENGISIKIAKADGTAIRIDASNISAKEIEKLLSLLDNPNIEDNQNIEIDKVALNSKEKGGVLAEVLLLVIPGLIALMLAGTFIYLLIRNEYNSNYSTPKELASAMTTIMGYYFGLGASAAVNKEKVLTQEEVKNLLNSKNQDNQS